MTTKQVISILIKVISWFYEDAIVTHTYLATEEPLLPTRYGATVCGPLKALVPISSVYDLRPPANQVREDRAFYVPDILSEGDYGAFSKEYAAAGDHAKHLRTAERLVCQAEDLVGLMRAAISYESDARAMQADTALAILEKKLCKAHSRINKHDRRHTNLFLAYADLSGKTDQGNKE